MMRYCFLILYQENFPNVVSLPSLPFLVSGLLNVDAERPGRSQNSHLKLRELLRDGKCQIVLGFNGLTSGYNGDYIMPQVNNISTLTDEDVLIILRDISLRSLLRVRQVNSNSRTC